MSEAVAPEHPLPDPPPPSAGRRFDRLLALLNRHPWLLPSLSFAFGVASFLLIQRGERLARVMAVIALVGWPWLLAEGALGRWIAHHSRGRLPEATARFLTQQVQQELLFFSLPFLFLAVQPVPGQILVVALASGLAIAAVLDPVWWHRIAPNTALSVGFHAGCTFVAALAILPIAVHVPLDRVLFIAYALSAATLLLALPRLLRAGPDRPPLPRRLLRVLLLAAVLGLAWLCRAAIPPAGLWVRDARIATTIDAREPGPAITAIDRADLAAGVVAHVSVRAPRGLAQSVVFEWRHEGAIVDRIPAEISGGRESGFRTWSRKQNFGENPVGRWQVDLRTPEGQLIARRRFEVR